MLWPPPTHSAKAFEISQTKTSKSSCLSVCILEMRVLARIREVVTWLNPQKTQVGYTSDQLHKRRANFLLQESQTTGCASCTGCTGCLVLYTLPSSASELDCPVLPCKKRKERERIIPLVVWRETEQHLVSVVLKHWRWSADSGLTPNPLIDHDVQGLGLSAPSLPGSLPCRGERWWTWRTWSWIWKRQPRAVVAVRLRDHWIYDRRLCGNWNFRMHMQLLL